MKINRILIILVSSVWIFSCVPLKPVTTIKNDSIKNYKYVYISQTKTLTSSSGATINGRYFSTSKSVNPSDVITGILAKEGFVLIPELKKELARKTLIVNYGESGKRNTGLGSYSIEVTIQFVSSESSSLICSCTAEGRGQTEADDIRQAITRCLESILPKEN